MNNNIYMGLAVMGSQKNNLQAEKNKLQDKIDNIEKQKNAQIADLNTQMDILNKKMLDIDTKMNKSKVLAQKEDENEAKAKALSQKEDDKALAQAKGGEVKAPTQLRLPVQEEDAPVSGGDASITTGSLDASSQTSGKGGAKPGWKFYDKIGKIEKRKKDSIREYFESVWDSYLVDKY